MFISNVTTHQDKSPPKSILKERDQTIQYTQISNASHLIQHTTKWASSEAKKNIKAENKANNYTKYKQMFSFTCQKQKLFFFDKSSSPICNRSCRIKEVTANRLPKVIFFMTTMGDLSKGKSKIIKSLNEHINQKLNRAKMEIPSSFVICNKASQ